MFISRAKFTLWSPKDPADIQLLVGDCSKKLTEETLYKKNILPFLNRCLPLMPSLSITSRALSLSFSHTVGTPNYITSLGLLCQDGHQSLWNFCIQQEILSLPKWLPVAHSRRQTSLHWFPASRKKQHSATFRLTDLLQPNTCLQPGGKNPVAFNRIAVLFFD